MFFWGGEGFEKNETLFKNPNLNPATAYLNIRELERLPLLLLLLPPPPPPLPPRSTLLVPPTDARQTKTK